MTTIGKNLWQKNMHISQSVRTGNFDRTFNLSAKYETPMSLYLDKTYKKALIKSASMRN